MKNKHVVYIVATAVLLWLGWKGHEHFRPCPEPTVVQINPADYTEPARIEDSIVKAAQKKTDSLVKIAAEKDSIADLYIDRANRLAWRLAQAKKDLDTFTIVVTQDSLIKVKDSTIDNLKFAGRIKDSTIVLQSAAIWQLDSLSNVKDSAYNRTYDALVNTQTQLDVCTKDKEKFRKQRNRSRWLNLGFIAFEGGRLIFQK